MALLLKEQEENTIDPNRDFPYNVGTEECMQTAAGQVINAIVKDHLFVSSITFHGGETSLTYPWGAYNHYTEYESPDNEAFIKVGKLMRDVAGSNTDLDVREYKFGNMGQVVYPVNGGLEDWIYAGSWEPEVSNDDKLVPQCHPSREFPTKEENTVYEEDQVRTLIYLAETANQKSPSELSFGNEMGVFDKEQQNGGIFGHIARNILMSMTLADMTAPYIKLVSLEQLSSGLRVVWQVKGCLTVDQTQVSWYWKINELSGSSQMLQGPGYWSNKSHTFDFTIPIDENDDSYPSIKLMISAVTDSGFSKQNSPVPNVKSQSHFVQMRTNPNYTAFNKEYSLGSYQNITYIDYFEFPSSQQAKEVFKWDLKGELLSCPHSSQINAQVSFNITENEAFPAFNMLVTFLSYDLDPKSSYFIEFREVGGSLECTEEEFGDFRIIFGQERFNLEYNSSGLWYLNKTGSSAMIQVEELAWSSMVLFDRDRNALGTVLLNFTANQDAIPVQESLACYGRGQASQFKMVSKDMNDWKLEGTKDFVDNLDPETKIYFEFPDGDRAELGSVDILIQLGHKETCSKPLIRPQTKQSLKFGDQILISYLNTSQILVDEKCIVAKGNHLLQRCQIESKQEPGENLSESVDLWMVALCLIGALAMGFFFFYLVLKCMEKEKRHHADLGTSGMSGPGEYKMVFSELT